VAAQGLRLLEVDGTFAICKMGAEAPVPPWAAAGPFCSVTRTADELSVVCCLRVAGAVPLSAVGVLAALTAPLAEAGISVFAVSTFDTDYLLVRADGWGRAVDVLVRYGHAVRKE
jgi:hypothetical protein